MFHLESIRSPRSALYNSYRCVIFPFSSFFLLPILLLHLSHNLASSPLLKPQAMEGNLPPAGAERINTNIVTLTRFLTEEQTKVPEATGEFT